MKDTWEKIFHSFSGWWGNDPDTRFKIPRTFEPVKAASAWALSNDPVLSMAALKASLDMFDEAGMENLRTKSEKLTAYLEFIVEEINRSTVDSQQSTGALIKLLLQKKLICADASWSLVFAKNGKEIYKKINSARDHYGLARTGCDSCSSCSFI